MSIGTLREQHLHASLKQYLAQPGDQFEQLVDGYQIDILRDNLLIEIQSANFSAMRAKLNYLLPKYEVLLVHPVAETKWIARVGEDGKQISRRKSPKRGYVETVFDELLYIPKIARHPNLQLAVLLTEQEEIWVDDGQGSWRRKHWSIADRRLITVYSRKDFSYDSDYLALLPNLEEPFTHKQLAEAAGIPVRTSTRMSYCLRKMGLLESVGRNGRELLLSTPAAIKSKHNGHAL